MKFFLHILMILKSCYVWAQQDDKAIYQTILDSTKRNNESFFVICSKTNNKEVKGIYWEEKYTPTKLVIDRGFIETILDTTWKQVLLSSANINEKGKKIKKNFSENIRFVSPGWIKRNYKNNIEDGWKNFYSIYPAAKGFWDFSEVIYSDDYKKAIVYMGVHRGGLDGQGEIFLLTYENDKWIIKYRIRMWVS